MRLGSRSYMNFFWAAMILRGSRSLTANMPWPTVGLFVAGMSLHLTAIQTG